MTKSVTIQVSDEVSVCVEIYYEKHSKCFSGLVRPIWNVDATEYGDAPELFWRVDDVWRNLGRSMPTRGANLVDSLARASVDLLTVIRIQGATDCVRDFRYEQVYGLIDAYFLMAVSEDVAQKEVLFSANTH